MFQSKAQAFLIFIELTLFTIWLIYYFRQSQIVNAHRDKK